MLRALPYKLRRIRPHTLFLLILIGLVIYCIQLPDSLAEHPTRDAGLHRAILVTTPSNTSYPLHYIPLDLTQGHALEARPLALGINPGAKQSVSHIVKHHGRHDRVYITNEVSPGSVLTGRLTDEGDQDGLLLKLENDLPSQGDLPAHTIITRDGKHLLVVNVSPLMTSDVRYRIQLISSTVPRLSDSLASHPSIS
jgi:hypothetical protein